MVKPVPKKDGFREIKFVERSFPEGHLAQQNVERLSRVVEENTQFLTKLNHRLPLGNDIRILKRIMPEVDDWETYVTITKSDGVIYSIFNDGIREPSWKAVGHAQ